MSTISYSEGGLTICLATLLDLMSPQDRRNLAEALSCESEIIRHVTAQILDGWTESGAHGPKGCDAPTSPAPHYGLDWAVREVSRRSGEVAAKEIARLEEALAGKDAELSRAYEENARMRRGTSSIF